MQAAIKDRECIPWADWLQQLGMPMFEWIKNRWELGREAEKLIWREKSQMDQYWPLARLMILLLLFILQIIDKFVSILILNPIIHWYILGQLSFERFNFKAKTIYFLKFNGTLKKKESIWSY